ncbi:hypothetical protein L284_01740 [Novosphingobium lindaniclasticum LE124]|uniref:Uncharacterized protein n=1 Tax=Novosphingobium lindaniclasticum LE124 TaxID=1096930 RepID=T0I287_9SPHN|nr:hypothetical protein L284_01740 [Novosphingobium lindaniclasticum LE124]
MRKAALDYLATLAMREWRVGLGRRPASHTVGLLYSLSRAERWERLSNRGIAKSGNGRALVLNG